MKRVVRPPYISLNPVAPRTHGEAVLSRGARDSRSRTVTQRRTATARPRTRLACQPAGVRLQPACCCSGGRSPSTFSPTLAAPRRATSRATPPARRSPASRRPLRPSRCRIGRVRRRLVARAFPPYGGGCAAYRDGRAHRRQRRQGLPRPWSHQQRSARGTPRHPATTWVLAWSPSRPLDPDLSPPIRRRGPGHQPDRGPRPDRADQHDGRNIGPARATMQR
jgi:hypothetical protein